MNLILPEEMSGEYKRIFEETRKNMAVQYKPPEEVRHVPDQSLQTVIKVPYRILPDHTSFMNVIGAAAPGSKVLLMAEDDMEDKMYFMVYNPASIFGIEYYVSAKILDIQSFLSDVDIPLEVEFIGWNYYIVPEVKRKKRRRWWQWWK